MVALMIVMLLPECDYDPTESALPWAALLEAGHEVCFATPRGLEARADERLLTRGFGPLSPLLMTRPDALGRYHEMARTESFKQPMRYEDVDPTNLDLLLVPGGHAPGMRSMLDSVAAKRIVVEQFRLERPVAAVCHGVLLLARSIDPVTNRSVLYGRRTTALPATMERPAIAITRPFLGDYYRTYPQTVQSEVVAALASPDDFEAGPLLPRRDRADRPDIGFCVRDGVYLSARWPGDCHRYAREVVSLLA
jgi:putative intracellular protease/amidase